MGGGGVTMTGAMGVLLPPPPQAPSVMALAPMRSFRRSRAVNIIMSIHPV
ncbi:hypothetical protein GCM10009069_21290 [Algimonas arctica]|uniref:Uncharacterized protein n=1 Tax=Algimonas arctica TaxID=1479486 RepID=A0A8J3G2N3_9PROT|nr:hypothetical protein GCM10009069_21290 [Algimonas arctica]